MKIFLGLALAASATAGLSGQAMADAGLAVSGGAGTTGGIVEIQAQINEFIQVRGGYNYFTYGVDDSYDGVSYDGDLDLSSLGAFVDIRPFKNSFIITGGAYFGDKSLDLLATPTSNVEIGNQTYTPAQVGSLGLTAELESTAPFVGLGFDTTFQGDGAWGFKLIAGAMMTGSPKVDLVSVGGLLTGNAQFEAEIAREEQNLQDEINDFEVYPVIQAGISYRF